ncbi:hypothetical protein GCM10008098_05180 [Rhodanobacter panaciterrae]|uniref:DUF3617 family protein n=1 Tax=Rhodanobacter panaciterrae TaxID=490572 RepID=A0ABQ2ZIA4_9GAMM|nr:DUF6491 family protein [Rhodanobacter panaciterrae]GGY16755.1 hypothetical protein GCM10008098_05180 [Rhodanobacter panaciterrae]
MKTLIPILLLALTVGAVQAAGTPPTRIPLHTSDCIDTSQINEWHIVDARTAIVRTGPKRYLVTLQSACPRLGMSPPGLMFRPNRSNVVANQGRICGEVGETVHSRNQPPCAIQSVSMIDKARFDQLSAHAKRHGSGADQPTTMPAH